MKIIPSIFPSLGGQRLQDFSHSFSCSTLDTNYLVLVLSTSHQLGWSLVPSCLRTTFLMIRPSTKWSLSQLASFSSSSAATFWTACKVTWWCMILLKWLQVTRISLIGSLRDGSYKSSSTLVYLKSNNSVKHQVIHFLVGYGSWGLKCLMSQWTPCSGSSSWWNQSFSKLEWPSWGKFLFEQSPLGYWSRLLMWMYSNQWEHFSPLIGIHWSSIPMWWYSTRNWIQSQRDKSSSCQTYFLSHSFFFFHSFSFYS